MGLNDAKRGILSTIYHDYTHPAGMGGVKGLLDEARKQDSTFSLAEVKQFLRACNVYTLHRTPRVNFRRLPILAPKPGTFLSVDLADMSSLSKHNKGYRYILIAVDIFSRKLQARAMKRKTGSETAKAIQSILDDPSTGSVRRIHGDFGREFYNKDVKSLLNKRNIRLYSTTSQEIKASHAERAIQTLKRLVYKYLTLKNSLSYVKVLQTLVEKYNNTPHSGLKCGSTPVQVHGLTQPDEIRTQFNRMYRNDQYKSTKKNTSSHCYQIGQTVRVTRDARAKAFYKSYHARFHEEYFIVHELRLCGCVPVYVLKDLNGEVLKGIFYHEEIIAVELPKDVFPLSVIKTKGTGSNKKYFVSWKGYPASFNCWIDKSAIEVG